MLPEMRTFHFTTMNAAKTSYLIKGPCRSKTDEKEGAILTSRQIDDEMHIETYLIMTNVSYLAYSESMIEPPCRMTDAITHQRPASRKCKEIIQSKTH